MSPEIFVALAFVIFIAVIYKPTKAFIYKALDQKILETVKDISNAAKLRGEAEEYFKSAQQNFNEAKENSISIVAQAQERANTILASVEKDIIAIADKKAQESVVRLKRQEALIIAELKTQAIEMAMELVKEDLAKELETPSDKNKQIKVIKKDIKGAKKIIINLKN